MARQAGAPRSRLRAPVFLFLLALLMYSTGRGDQDRHGAERRFSRGSGADALGWCDFLGLRRWRRDL